MLRVRIDRPEPVYQMATLVLDILADGLGLAYRVVPTEEPCDVVYAPNEPTEPDVLWLPATVADWRAAIDDDVYSWNADTTSEQSRSTHGVSTEDTDPAVPFIGPTLDRPNATGGPAGDILFSSWYVLTGAIEKKQPRNRFGVPIIKQSDAVVQAILSRPLVAQYVDLLSRTLRARLGSRFLPVPRWPGGARFAIVLSHDVDRPFSRPPLSHYRQRIRRDVRAFDLPAVARGLGGFAKNVLLRGDAGSNALRDPNFGFDKWKEFEESIAAKSAFYVAVRNSADDGALWEEVNYHFMHPAILDRLKHLSGEGWEIGLHASIACRTEPLRFAFERKLLGDAIGTRIRGVRHHYWALDRDDPEKTLQQHAEAGFDYDSSLGFNDSPGFRRGMAWPFNPIGANEAQSIDVLQVPPTAMDGGIFYSNPTREQGEEAIRSHIRIVADVGGAVVFNWHLEQQNPDRLAGAGPALMQVLNDYHGDTDVFWASPAQVVDWWEERRRLIVASA